jgi:hypothetical protein
MGFFINLGAIGIRVRRIFDKLMLKISGDNPIIEARWDNLS